MRRARPRSARGSSRTGGSACAHAGRRRARGGPGPRTCRARRAAPRLGVDSRHPALFRKPACARKARGEALDGVAEEDQHARVRGRLRELARRPRGPACTGASTPRREGRRAGAGSRRDIAPRPRGASRSPSVSKKWTSFVWTPRSKHTPGWARTTPYHQVVPERSAPTPHQIRRSGAPARGPDRGRRRGSGSAARPGSFSDRPSASLKHAEKRRDLLVVHGRCILMWGSGAVLHNALMSLALIADATRSRRPLP